MPAARPLALLNRYWPGVLLALLPALVHLPVLTGWFCFDPLYIVSGVTDGTWHSNGLLPGYPGWIDGNAGVTTEALGTLAARDWLAGIVPWWNPFSGIGLPLAAEGQTPAMFLPFVLLLALPHGLLLLRLVLMVLAGFGAFALLRALQLTRVAAFTGAALFQLNGSFAWLAHGPMLPIAFLPLMLLGAEQARQSRFAWAMVAGVAFSFLAGFPETAALNLLFAAAWCALRLAQARARLRYAANAGTATLAGLMLAAPAIWAFLQALPNEFLGVHDGRTAGYLTAGNWALMLFPYVHGNVMQAPLQSGRLAALWYSAGGYADVVLVGMALLALRRRGQDMALRWVLFAWMVVTGLRAAGVAPLVALFGMVPFLGQAMVHLYMMPSWALALSVLAAFTVQDWHQGAPFRPLSAILVLLFLAMAALGAAHADFFGPLWVPALAVLLPVPVLTIVVLLLRGSPARAPALAACLVTWAALLAAFPLLAGTHRRKLDVAAIRFLQQNTGLQRVVTFGPLVPNYGAMFGIAEISHNYLPVPANWAAAIRARLLPSYDGVNFYDGTAPSRAAIDAYKSMAVGYALVWPGADLADTVPGATRAFQGRVMDIWSIPDSQRYATAAGCTITGGRTVFHVQCPVAATLLRRELFWPGWSATVNGRSAAITAEDIFQSVAVPEGASDVVFTYAPPGIAWAWVSAAVALAFVFWRGNVGRGEAALPNPRPLFDDSTKASFS